MPSSRDQGPPPRNGVGLAALTLGIVAVALVFIPFSTEIVTAAVGIAAVVAGFIGWDRADRGIATNRSDALIGGILGLLASIAALMVYSATNGGG
ncbi:hypothetical protein GOARA_043_00630 [Gordonia araii NBRC 100433]|uniref:DUF4190 domain-containing protein n=1 Tax=Gordonia araii NBRC 100433 TaxID=1073574 RepID=G7H127_9ACTN|nr:hypothetical protein [Gordonia araii]NNG96726.1 hypothetical protein [Gordonia araii NBRC 100433]GAB09588.1 hypothetical protein GOARA_043_00630 [Gordonia araii NBRC 100433]